MLYCYGSQALRHYFEGVLGERMHVNGHAGMLSGHGIEPEERALNEDLWSVEDVLNRHNSGSFYTPLLKDHELREID